MRGDSPQGGSGLVAGQQSVTTPVTYVRRHLPGDHVDMRYILVGEDAGLPALDVANHSNPVPAVRRHLPGDHVDLPDISVSEDAGSSALDVANYTNPVPDVRRHLPGDHVDLPDICNNKLTTSFIVEERRNQ